MEFGGIKLQLLLSEKTERRAILKEFKNCRKCQDQISAKNGPRGDARGGPELRPLATAAAATVDHDEQERGREVS